MRKSFQILQRLFLLVVVTVALTATGFAHYIPTAEDSALEAYVLAGGDPGDLCGDADGDGLPDHSDCPGLS